MVDLPQLFTSRFLAEAVLTTRELIPVRISYQPPLIPVTYEIEHSVPELMPEPIMFGEWPRFSASYWVKLDTIGLQRIGARLAAISEEFGGKALALCCHEDLQRGFQCHRVLASSWLELQTGRAVPELTSVGEVLELHELHKQSHPNLPEVSEEAQRLASPEWPLTQEELERWIESARWQFARTMPKNPHEYTLKKWHDPESFERVVHHIRENGYPNKYGSWWYTQLDVGGHFYWTQGADLCCTILINRKPLQRTHEGGGRSENSLF